MKEYFCPGNQKPLVAILLHVLVFTVGISAEGCHTPHDQVQPPAAEASLNTTQAGDSLLKADSVAPPRYHILHLNDSTRKALRKKYSVAQLSALCKLNRVELRRLNRLDSLLLPNSFPCPWTDLSPFPLFLPPFADFPHFIVVSYPIQAFAAYDSGQLVRWGPVSMGKKSTPTPRGLFYTNWKSKRQISTINPEWIMPWYVNIENRLGVSFHQYELPGYPASHSCIRLAEDDARWLYSYAHEWTLSRNKQMVIQNGTPVLIFGLYPFGKGRPWYELAKNPHYGKTSADEVWRLYQQEIRK